MYFDRKIVFGNKLFRNCFFQLGSADFPSREKEKSILAIIHFNMCIQ